MGLMVLQCFDVLLSLPDRVYSLAMVYCTCSLPDEAMFWQWFAVPAAYQIALRAGQWFAVLATYLIEFIVGQWFAVLTAYQKGL